MAKRISVIVTDDLDGTGDAETVIFGLDGVTYEIDLGEKNRARFAKALAPYVAAGRKVPRGGRRRAVRRPSGSRADRTGIRAWAKAAGLKVSDRGRISADVVRQYGEAH